MHFGYYKKVTNPFNCEQMLKYMNQAVLRKLNISGDKTSLLVDLGCGFATSMRQACSEYLIIKCTGVTLVPWQKQQAESLNRKTNLQERIHIHLNDSTDTTIKSSSVNHVMAIESSCYAKGSNKSDFLKEIKRIIKPGVTFVIADGFLKSSANMSPLLSKAYHQLCQSWALDEGNINQVCEELKVLKLEGIVYEDISWKVAPSVAHVSYTVLKFLTKQLFIEKGKMNKERWDNLKSPLLTMILGLHTSHFVYYLISGIKPNKS